MSAVVRTERPAPPALLPTHDHVTIVRYDVDDAHSWHEMVALFADLLDTATAPDDGPRS